MPAEIAMPFRLSPSGGIAVEVDPDRQISQHVQSLVGTSPGERVLLVGYGVPLPALLFEPNDDMVTREIVSLIEEALERWEPGTFLRRVTPILNESGDGLADVAVDFSRTDAPDTDSGRARNVNTAIVRVGGRVEETVRG
jgi:phage baseplate assembly protein W